MDDDEPACCAGCGTGRSVNWCPAYGEYLCDQCKWSKTEAELRPAGLIAGPSAGPACDCCPPI